MKVNINTEYSLLRIITPMFKYIRFIKYEDRKFVSVSNFHNNSVRKVLSW